MHTCTLSETNIDSLGKEHYPNPSPFPGAGPSSPPQQTKATTPTTSAPATSSAPEAAVTSLVSNSKAEIDALFGIAPTHKIVSLSQDSFEEVPLTEKPQRVVDLLSQLEMEIAPTQDTRSSPHPRGSTLSTGTQGEQPWCALAALGSRRWERLLQVRMASFMFRWASGGFSGTEHGMRVAMPCHEGSNALALETPLADVEQESPGIHFTH